MIDFDTTNEEAELISAIAKRAVSINPSKNQMDVEMDITATHLNGCL